MASSLFLDASSTIGGTAPVEALFAVFFTVTGMVVGSYLNVVVHRLPLGVSTVSPSSRCPRCSMPIRSWHNVPVLGWIVLGGRCRDCGVPISARYPAVEAATGALFLAAWLRFTTLLEVAVAAGFGSLFVVLALLDLDHRKLPVVPIHVAALAALGLQPILGWAPPLEALLVAIAAAAFLALLSAAWRRRRGDDGFGRGDVEMIMLLGALFGAEGTLVAFCVACGVGLLGVLLAAARPAGARARARASVPFGTCLAAGAFVAFWLAGGA